MSKKTDVRELFRQVVGSEKLRPLHGLLKPGERHTDKEIHAALEKYKDLLKEAKGTK